MAYTKTLIKNTVFGNQRVIQYKVSADAVSGAVTAPLSYIDVALLTPISMTTNAILVKVNTTLGSAVANGSVYLANVTSSDDFFLILYGR
jgi:hypothetical protein